MEVERLAEYKNKIKLVFDIINREISDKEQRTVATAALVRLHSIFNTLVKELKKDD